MCVFVNYRLVVAAPYDGQFVSGPHQVVAYVTSCGTYHVTVVSNVAFAVNLQCETLDGPAVSDALLCDRPSVDLDQ